MGNLDTNTIEYASEMELFIILSTMERFYVGIWQFESWNISE